LAGFTSAEGCFHIKIKKSNTHLLGFQVELLFQITQHYRDELLMRSLVQYLDCGNIYNRGEVCDFRVTKFTDIENKILPLFTKYKIVGVKACDFSDFCRVVELMKDKKHLTQ